MESLLPLALTPEDLERFVKTFSRDDTFTVLYLLTKAEAPRALEDLCRQYGASATEMKDRLERLRDLGLINRRGRGYLASPKAVVAMRSLEERLGKVEDLPAVATMAAAPAFTPSYVGNEVYSAALIEAATNNETSFSLRLTAAVSKPAEAPAPPRMQPANENSLTSATGLPKHPNATRSQHYM